MPTIFFQTLIGILIELSLHNAVHVDDHVVSWYMLLDLDNYRQTIFAIKPFNSQ